MRKSMAIAIGLAVVLGVTGCASVADTESTPGKIPRSGQSTTAEPYATGTPLSPAPGFPAVSFDEDGKPTVEIPDTPAPTTTEIALLKQGNGATVADGDTVTVQYQGVNWTTKEVFDQSWGRGPATFPTTGVIPGFAKALLGQQVGSQVLVVIPPTDGYGDAGQPAAGISGTDTLVFVIDILDTTPQ